MVHRVGYYDRYKHHAYVDPQGLNMGVARRYSNGFVAWGYSQRTFRL
jgi:hypothetical protein